jgi:hypothetical protein
MNTVNALSMLLWATDTISAAFLVFHNWNGGSFSFSNGKFTRISVASQRSHTLQVQQ